MKRPTQSNRPNDTGQAIICREIKDQKHPLVLLLPPFKLPIVRKFLSPT